VVTGMAGISPVGADWPTVRQRLQARVGAVVCMEEWKQYQGLNTLLAAPAVPFDLPPERYPRKAVRAMGRVSILAVRAADLALADAGLAAPVWRSGRPPATRMPWATSPACSSTRPPTASPPRPTSA
jgi:3-oxoacyl-[acyl-carrier-protein] synthase II